MSKEREMEKVFVSEARLRQLYDFEEEEKRRSGVYATKFEERWGCNLRSLIFAATEEMVKSGDDASLVALSLELDDLSREVKKRIA